MCKNDFEKSRKIIYARNKIMILSRMLIDVWCGSEIGVVRREVRRRVSWVEQCNKVIWKNLDVIHEGLRLRKSMMDSRGKECFAIHEGFK